MSVIAAVFNGQDIVPLSIDGQPLPYQPTAGEVLRITIPEGSVTRRLRAQAAEFAA